MKSWNANNSEHAEPKKEDRALEEPVQNIVDAESGMPHFNSH
jgi:hypothetical protein